MFGLRTFLLSLAALSATFAHGQTWPTTRAERTNYAETSHYDDVIAFISELQKAGAPVSMEMMALSAKGKQIPLVIASYPPVSTPEQARKLGRPIVYIQANIHAGEVEGKEAILAILRRLSQDGPNGLLGKIVLITTPIYNIDGNEAFGPVTVNRPEQDGPNPVGQRANGQNLDLNRDAIKAEAPETKVAMNIYNTWDPEVMMDLHTTDGTRHGWELTYAPPLNPNTDPEIMKFTRDRMIPDIRRETAAKYKKLLFDYGNVEGPAGHRGWYTYGVEGRYCTNYVGLRNRISILSEATAFIPFKDRVEVTDHFVTSVLNYTASHAGEVMRITREADARVTGYGLDPKKAPKLGVRFDFDSRGQESVPIETAASRKKAELVSRPPTSRPTELDHPKLAIYDRFKATKTADFPAAYCLGPTAHDLARFLISHGIVVEEVQSDWSGDCFGFTIDELKQSARPFQGHRLIQLNGHFTQDGLNIGHGTYIVRTSQPLGILAFHILEPESLDGAAAWGLIGDLHQGQQYPIEKIMTPIKVATTVVP